MKRRWCRVFDTRRACRTAIVHIKANKSWERELLTTLRGFELCAIFAVEIDSQKLIVALRLHYIDSGYIWNKTWNKTETKQFHWNKTSFCVWFVSVLFQFYFRCNHFIRDRAGMSISLPPVPRGLCLFPYTLPCSSIFIPILLPVPSLIPIPFHCQPRTTGISSHLLLFR